ncbi:MAG: 30S ribosomal protein S20 [Actinobacteria bacterium]|nr:30S ribosomal protein S20 [Actinomycetota bacterium]
MPNIKSQIKRLRQAEKRRIRNKSIKSEVRTYIKKFEAALSAGNLQEAENLFTIVQKKIDKAVSKGIFHKNTGSRKISKIAKKLAALRASSKETA